MRRPGGPPELMRHVLGALLPPRDRAAVLEEMDVLYERRAERYGRARADAWYAVQVPSFALRVLGYVVLRGPVVPVGVGQGVRGGLRGLRRAPLYAVASITTLGVGVAALSSVHAVANWSLLRPVPGVGAAPGELVTIELNSRDSRGSWPISDPDFGAIAARVRTLDGVAAATAQELHVVRGSGSPERETAQAVTESYFDVLGVRMLSGRAFTPGEASGAESPHVLVVSESWASSGWDSPEHAVGSELIVNGRPYTIVGVVTDGFRGETLPGRTDLWFPGSALPDVLHDPAMLTRADRQVWAGIVGRRAAGATLEAIESELNALMDAIRQEKAGQAHSFLATHFVFRTYDGIGLEPALRPGTMRTLSILGGSAFLLLLLSCANVANLGLARAAGLGSAIALRRALGAGAGAILLERLVESALVGFAGGVLGMLLGGATIGTLRAAGLGLLGVPLDGVSMDWRVVATTLFAGTAAGGVAGVLPAIATSRERAASLLRSARHGHRTMNRMGRLLVVAQVAISAVLLIGAVLLARTLLNLQRIDLGVRDIGVLAFEVDPGLQGYDGGSTASLIEELSAAIANGAGIESVAAVWSPPYDLLSVPYVLKRPDAEWDGAGSGMARSFQSTALLFETLGIELIAGRTFRESDGASGERIAILNETAARTLFPGEAAASLIGRTVERRGVSEPSIRIIGVVRDARLERPALPARPYIFVPWSQGIDVGRFTMYVRTDRPLESVSPMIREMVAGTDPALPVYGMRTWSGEIRSLLSDQRLVASLALGLAAFGLVLAAIGLYGVLAVAVTRRTREIGIRCALGARPGRLLAAVVRSAFVTSIAGLLPGLLAAAWLSSFLESRLYGVGRLDPGTYILGSATLLLVVLVASWLPARRAMRVDPTVALRQD